jgi:hypothetical protein
MSVLALQGVPFTATVTAAGHTPKIDTKWAYTVKVVDRAGKPVAATISIVVVDPIGGVHPVHRYASGQTLGKAVTKLPIKGVFSDAVRWPLDAKGYPLAFRVIVIAAGTKRTVTYTVTPR